MALSKTAELTEGLLIDRTAIRARPGSVMLVRAMLWAVVLLLLAAASQSIDTTVTSLRHSQLIPGDLRRIIALSEIFGHGFGIAVCVALLWKLSPERRRLLPRMLACAILPGLAVLVVKLVVVRRRPGFFWPEYADRVSDTWIGFASLDQLNLEYVTQSFPSAHAATAVGLAAGLAWMFPAARTAFFVLAFLAGFQRVFAGAHWTSDVLAGAALAIVVSALVLHRPTKRSP